VHCEAVLAKDMLTLRPPPPTPGNFYNFSPHFWGPKGQIPHQNTNHKAVTAYIRRMCNKFQLNYNNRHALVTTIRFHSRVDIF